MGNSGEGSLWRRIGRQSVWGRRGLIKTGSFWLPFAALAWDAPEGQLAGLWLPCMLLFLATACRTQGATLANDLADKADDQAAGKDRWVARLPLGAGVGVVLALLALGVGAVALARADALTIAAYLTSVLLGLLYSLPPARCKQRGVVGLVVFSLQCVAAYALVPWLWFGADATWLLALVPPLFLDKWVNIHFHQVVDHAVDAARGCGTYAARVGVDRARRTLAWAARLASAAMLGTMGHMALRLPSLGAAAVAIAGAAVAAAGGYAWWSRRRAAGGTALVRELPWHYLALTYSLFRLLPPLLLAGLALRAPTMAIPAAMAGLSFLAETWLFASYRYR